jgi:hypothetical protein
MSGPLCIITREQAMAIVNHLETMFEIFSNKMVLFDAISRQRFFEAKNRIHIILSESMNEERRWG